jgi:hypothetical protein
MAINSSAQSVLAPPPLEFAPMTNQPATLPGTNTTELSRPEASGATPAAPRRLWDLGRVHLHPRLFYSLSYGNGIQSQPGNQSRTLVNTLSPGISADIGGHWHLDYTPSLRYYSSHHFKDQLDHSAGLNWGTAYANWAIAFSQSYASSSSPIVETASQTDAETYSTALTAACQLNTKISLSFAVSQSFRYLSTIATNQALSDSRNWSTTEEVNYQIWPCLSAGVSVGFGYDDLIVGSDMMSETIQGQVGLKLADKLHFSLHGGIEDRQFLGSGSADVLNPILGLSAVYNPFEFTTISLNASRSVNASYFQNEITEVFGFNANIHQRLLQRLYLDITGGFSSTTYQATTTGLAIHRKDDRTTINVRLSCPFLQKGTASVFYDWSDNSSNEDGFSYTSNQMGLELGYRF